MFGAVTRLFRGQSKPQAVSIFFVGSDVYVATEYGADGSEPCYVVGPVLKVSISAGAAAIGKAVSDGLAACRYDFPAPATREDWKAVQFPVLQSTGSRSWAALAKRSNSLTVRRQGASVKVLPTYRDKQGFSPVVDRELVMQMPTDTQLGEIVVAELLHARRTEGPA